MDQQPCDDVTPCLYQWGPARLEYQGKTVRLSRKGLAILYYLALEGPTRREVLADLLWGHSGSAQNLRVELSQLRHHLAFLDEVPFQSGEDPLRLPASISLDQSSESAHQEVMEGLDDISQPFQEWLEEQRGRFHFLGVRTDLRNQLVREVAQQLSPPCLLVLKGSLGAGKLSFAQALAHASGVSCFSGLRGRGASGVHYLKPPYPEDAFEYITAHQDNIWIIDQEACCEEPELILRLLEHFPAERAHNLELPRLPWTQVRESELAELPFGDAAALYLAADGRPGYLAEYRKLHQRQRTPSSLTKSDAVPQRLRAMFQLRMRELCLEGRLALERLSVHPGPFPEGLIDTFEARPYLEELERLGWLKFEEGWSLSEEVMRKVLVDSLQAGRQRSYHRTAAEYFAQEQQPLARAYHLLQAGMPADPEELCQHLAGWQEIALRAHYHLPVQLHPVRGDSCALAEELMLNESWREGSLELNGSRLVFVRNVLDRLPSRVAWHLPDEPCVLHLAGAAYIENALAVGTGGDAIPLELEVVGAPAARVTWIPALPQPGHADERLLLPLDHTFESWLRLPAGATVVLTCSAEAGLMDLEFSLHAVATGPKGRGAAPAGVVVFDPGRVEA